MNKFLFTILLALLIISCKREEQQHQHHAPDATAEVVDTLKKSIPKETHAMLGSAHITIKYHAPALRGRVIWNGLVAYDQVWVTGAHNATSFETSEDLLMGGQSVPAGKYALFTIPSKDTWTFIVNRNWDQHLADEYDQKDDLFRIPVTPVVNDANQERLRYRIDQRENGETMLVMEWEKLAIRVPVRQKEVL